VNLLFGVLMMVMLMYGKIVVSIEEFVFQLELMKVPSYVANIMVGGMLTGRLDAPIFQRTQPMHHPELYVIIRIL
jgi:hypothetical protein